MFITGPGNRGSIPGRFIPKTQKIILDTTLLNTQYYKVWIKSKVGQVQRKESRPSLHVGVIGTEKCVDIKLFKEMPSLKNSDIKY